MQQKTLLTLEQFFAMPDDGHDYELVHGELVRMPPQEFQHESCKNLIAGELFHYSRQHQQLGRVFVETGSVLDEDSWRKPDVAFFRLGRIAEHELRRPLHGAPELCVEVVSPSNTHREIEDKTRHFLATGASVVWVAYPETREVHVVTKADARWLGPSDTLEQPDLLPGFAIRVSDLFEAPRA